MDGLDEDVERICFCCLETGGTHALYRNEFTFMSLMTMPVGERLALLVVKHDYGWTPSFIVSDR